MHILSAQRYILGNVLMRVHSIFLIFPQYIKSQESTEDVSISKSTATDCSSANHFHGFSG
jgi:hypothetical protein